MIFDSGSSIAPTQTHAHASKWSIHTVERRLWVWACVVLLFIERNKFSNLVQHWEWLPSENTIERMMMMRALCKCVYGVFVCRTRPPTQQTGDDDRWISMRPHNNSARSYTADRYLTASILPHSLRVFTGDRINPSGCLMHAQRTNTAKK